MQLLDDIDHFYKTIKDTGVLIGYIVGYGLATLFVLALVALTIAGAMTEKEKPIKPQVTVGMPYYDAQGHKHREGEVTP